ncbi:MRC1-like domain-containing protein [Massariosphaeria phaeospora]|uniref:MRC1-like domain-containing protein n=1 Tax=Massariosphaeria phaeospora TaxID=100035 RepID=A0A7C8MIW5_9PLEO|nr:MRC1-like domain-containing protein [Massariosphaeria phaeospora]
MAVDIELEEEDTIDSANPSHPAQPTRPTNALSKLIDSDSESEHERVQAPRGKLLARLQLEPTEVTSDNEQDDDSDGAYERMKKALMVGEGQGEQQTHAHPVSHIPEASTSEDDDDIPVRTTAARRLAGRKQKTPSPQASPSPSTRSRRTSPGLFVSPNPSPVAKRSARLSSVVGSEAENSPPSSGNSDLEERVRRIRAERKLKQTQEQNKRPRVPQRQSDGESDSDPDGETGRRLTQHSRPTRKAGKKALEEMARDQQRISRNMQLTHQAKTKKKYGTKDLLARLGYDQINDQLVPVQAPPTPDASSILASSDVEGDRPHDTPPTSPPSEPDEDGKVDQAGHLATPMTTQTPRDEVASLPAPATSNKGKGRAPEFQHVPVNPAVSRTQTLVVQNVQLDPKKSVDASMVELSDSDDDLETVQPKSRFPVFDRLPEQKKHESSSLLHLRHLAHLTSPSKRGVKGGKLMNATQLQFSLARKARLQAHQERAEKVEDMRRRGIHVVTEEEREKQQLEVEDIVAQFEKARNQDLKLAKFEKDQAKKNGETGDGLLSSDEFEDDDYVGSGEENGEEDQEMRDPGEEVDFELSGSEEGIDGEDGLEGDEEAADASNDLLDDMAEEDDEESEEPQEQQLNEDADMEDEDLPAPVRKRTTHRSRNLIVDDDDESDNERAQEATLDTQVASQATQDLGMAAFGFGNAQPALGLTQVFAGTMADLASESQSAHPLDKEPEQDSLDFLRGLPDTQPSVGFSQETDLLVPNSQVGASQQDESQAGTETQLDLGISQLIGAFSQTQEMPEPTQDAGFELSRSPGGFMPMPSTTDTVMMPVAESPVVARKGKLQRGRREASVELSDVDENEASSEESDFENEQRPSKANNVFSVMKKAAKKKQVIDDFNKKTSWARDAIEEQAEESEDEYAGLGGASDEDSGEEDEELAKMIDTGDVKVDERKVAAFFAARSKADDEKNINQLYKDITTGGLRKKAGGNAFEMSDSEDEAQLRQRKKQMDYKKMTKALLADDRIGKIAQNPKQAAFFQTLADHIQDPDYDFLNAPDGDVDMQTSQSQSDENKEGNEDITVPDSQSLDIAAPAPVNPLKRKPTDSQEKENRPPPHLRRTAASDSLARKPMTFADVQLSVSELLEDTRIVIPDSQYSDSESDAETPVTNPLPRKPIIDRLTLSRSASAASEADANAANLAFHAPAAGAQPGFRVPSLIRRATSNLSAASERAKSGVSTPVEGGVRRGGTGRSNIHAQAREAERRAVLDKAEVKRKESLKKKVGKARGSRSVLRDLGGGFE